MKEKLSVQEIANKWTDDILHRNTTLAFRRTKRLFWCLWFKGQILKPIDVGYLCAVIFICLNIYFHHLWS